MRTDGSVTSSSPGGLTCQLHCGEWGHVQSQLSGTINKGCDDPQYWSCSMVAMLQKISGGLYGVFLRTPHISHTEGTALPKST